MLATVAVSGGPAVAQRVGAEASNETWRGTYVCSQGATELELVVTRGTARQPIALFHFSGPARSIPKGCFAMRGTEIGKRLALIADHWIMQPFGFVMVNLDGTIDQAAGTYSGRVNGPGYTSFALHRVEATGAPAACAGVAV